MFAARGLRVGGPYTVTISGGGFENNRVEDLYLGLDQSLSLPVTVSLASAVAVIQVNGCRNSGSGFVYECLSTTIGFVALGVLGSIAL